MVFNSLTFIVFFLIVLAFHYSVQSFKTQKVGLLVASYVFYGVWNPPFVLLLVFSTALDWFTGRKTYEASSQYRKKLFLIVSLVGNLGPLLYFKYGIFFLKNFEALLSNFGFKFVPPVDSILLPVGISFYTFQTMSYTLDIYRGKMKPTKSFIDFALYVTFFPQLVAGPIVRAIDFLPQLITPRKATSNQFFWGLYLLTLGLFQKVVLADVFMAPSADTVFNWNKGPLSLLDAWTGALAFTGQIFFDFNGYSLCAIGISLCLGFHIMDNFKSPYASIGFSDFWRRWHISLSTFLRDYLYIPLGGNRGNRFLTMRNLMITMLLGGLWHGASWTFIVWGLLHGIYLVVERILKRTLPPSTLWTKCSIQFLLWVVTLFFITITWVIFRAKDLQTIQLLLLVMVGIIPNGAKILSTVEIVKVFSLFSALLITHWSLRNSSIEKFKEKLPALLLIVSWAIMLFTIVIAQGGGNAFIYFQF